KLLRAVGVKEDVLFGQAVAELQKDTKKRAAALDYLAGQPVDEARRQEVSKIVGSMVNDADHGVSQNALKVLEKYATRDNLQQLIDIVKAGGALGGEQRKTALAMLGKSKDPRAAPVLCEMLTNFFHHQQAKEALEALGRAAEPEVVKLMNS